MHGKSIKEFTIKRSKHAKTMAATSKNAVKIGDEIVTVDHQLLLLQLIVTMIFHTVSFSNLN